MTRRFFFCTLVAAALVAAATAQSEHRDLGVDPASWVPAEAVVYVGIADVGRLWFDFKKTASFRTMADPDLGAAGGILGELVQQSRQRIAVLLGVEPAELKNPFSGPLALCIVPQDSADAGVELMLVAGVSDPALARKYFDAALVRLKEHATGYETRTAAGQQVHVLTYPQQRVEKPELGLPMNLVGGFQPQAVQQQLGRWLDELFSPQRLPAHLAVCLTADRLIVAGSAARVERVLSGALGKTLADTDDYQLVLKSFRPLGQKRILVNFERAAELVSGTEGQTAPLRELLTAARQQGLRSAVGHVRVGTRAYEWKCEFLLVMSKSAGAQDWLASAENRPLTPPDWVPAGTVVYLNLNADVSGLFGAVFGLAGLMAMGGAGLSQMPALPGGKLPAGVDEAELALQMEKMREKMPAGVAVAPVSGPFAGLSGPLYFTVGFSTPYKSGCSTWLASVGHKDQEAIRQALTALSAMGGGSGPPQEVKGVPVYTEPFSKAACAATADRLLIGRRASVEAALGAASAAEKLADEPTFVAARRLVPREAWFVAYVDYPRMLKALSELARNREDLPPDSLEGILLTTLELGGVDWSDPVRADKLREYASAWIATASNTPDGVLLTAVMLPPARSAEAGRP
jgi:hypothetical protein